MRQDETVLEEVNTCFTEELIHRLSETVGQSQPLIRQALQRLVPLVINTLQNRVARLGGEEVLWAVTQQAREADALAHLSTPAALNRRGVLIMQGLLGDAYDSITEGVALTVHLPEAALEPLWEVAVGAVLGTFAQYAAEHQLDAAGLGNWLQQQQSIVTATVLPGAGAVPPPTEAARATTASAEKDLFHRFTVAGAGTWEKVGGGITFTPSQRSVRSSKKLRWQWALLLLPLIGLGYVGASYITDEQPVDSSATTSPPATDAVAASYNATNNSPATTPASAVPAGHYDATTDTYIYNTGQPLVLTLPDGSQLNVGSNSTEYQLYHFLADPNQQVGQDTPATSWINVDRVYFTSGAATLTAESQQQLHNLARILKAFPRVRIKVGGYTDSTGDEQKNLLLSQARATTAMQALAKLGVHPSRLQAEGYGAHNFVATNAGPVGRALNRRLSLQVTSKSGAPMPAVVAAPAAAAAATRAVTRTKAVQSHAKSTAEVGRTARRPSKATKWLRKLFKRKRNRQD